MTTVLEGREDFQGAMEGCPCRENDRIYCSMNQEICSKENCALWFMFLKLFKEREEKGNG